MGWTHQQLRDLEVRRGVKPTSGDSGVPLESKLHESIIDYCNSQWPRWKFIRARMDKMSTIQAGAQDFTIFLPCGRLLCVECKRKTGKVSLEQAGWAIDMAKLGHPVHVVRSLDEFLTLVDSANFPQEHRAND